MKNKKNKGEQIYRTTGVLDLLSSPAFYAVLFLSAFLGLFTVYGFIDNPLRLKAKVDSLIAKVFPSERQIAIHNIELLSDNDALAKYVGSLVDNTDNTLVDNNRYGLFSEQFLDSSMPMVQEVTPHLVPYFTPQVFLQDNEIQPISLDEKLSNKNSVIGVPLKPSLIATAQMTSL